ncbi:hypothetical protein [Kribbella sp. NPDC050470]|uniref:hypothetical protein n=1 Tax=unclassified Kribbella TaxID=2644121 RepID=UPI0037910685
MTQICPCGSTVKDALVCSNCSHKLQVALGDISSYWVDLDNVKGRQTRYSTAHGGRGAEKPLPVDARFLDWDGDGTRIQELTKNTIGTWGRAVAEDRPVISGPIHDACLHLSCNQARRSRPPRDDVPAVCRYLLGHVDWIRTQHWAPDILDELWDLAEQLRRMIDRPQDRECIGLCDNCPEMLYRRPGALKAKCRHCETEYDDAADRRTGLMGELHDRCLTAAEIEIAFTDIGKTPLTASRVRKWAERDRLPSVGSTLVRGRWLPTYRVSDVWNLLTEEARPKAG